MFQRLFFLLCVAAGWTGCATSGWYLDKGVYYRKDLTVELERATSGTDAPKTGFAHPAQVPEAAVVKLVAGLTYDDRGTRRAVVHQDSVPELAAALVKGLARADATSRVRFLVMNPGRTMFFFRSTTSTRGVAFVKPAGVLNLAFDLVDEVTEFEDDEWVDAIAESRSEMEISPPAGAQYHVNADGKTSNPRWIVLPLGPDLPLPATRVTATRAAGTEAAANKPPVLDTTRTVLPTAEPRPVSVVPAQDSKPTATRSPADQPASQDRPDQLDQPDRALPVKAPGRLPAGTATSVKTGTDTETKKPLTSEQILQRLRTLEKLYDEGTITEEQYRNIRRKLLGTTATTSGKLPGKKSSKTP